MAMPSWQLLWIPQHRASRVTMNHEPRRPTCSRYLNVVDIELHTVPLCWHEDQMLKFWQRS